MSITYEIDGEHKLISTVWDGVVTMADILKHQDTVLKDLRFSPEFDELADLTAVTALDISSDAIQRLALRRVYSNTSRRAAVVSSKEVYGILRMFVAYHELAGLIENWQLFETREAALRWISGP